MFDTFKMISRSAKLNANSKGIQIKIRNVNRFFLVQFSYSLDFLFRVDPGPRLESANVISRGVSRQTSDRRRYVMASGWIRRRRRLGEVTGKS